MSLAEVLQPALDLASEGFPVHPGLRGPSDYLPFSICHSVDTFRQQWPTSAQLYMPQGRVPDVGEVWRNPDLAQTFSLLLDAERAGASQGRAAGLHAARDAFYRGDMAPRIVAFAQRHGGLLELDDLATFTTRVKTPASLQYRGYDVFKCGPWSQGPVFLQQLRLVEGYDLRALGHNGAAYIHLVTEASKLAFADREAYYGDPDFVPVPLPALLSAAYTVARRQLIDPERASLALRRVTLLPVPPCAPGRACVTVMCQIPKMCLELGLGENGLIGHTQPRRLAARTVAERIAEELGVEIGQEVGFQVRFTGEVSRVHQGQADDRRHPAGRDPARQAAAQVQRHHH